MVQAARLYEFIGENATMTAPQSINPYASPRAEQQAAPVLPSRQHAQRIVRWTLAILVVPVAVNIWAGFYWNAGGRELVQDYRPIMVVLNAVWFAVVFTVLWFIGLWLIELLARVLYGIFGGDLSREAWLTSLHESLWPMIPVAFIGAALWIAWLCLFFLADHPGGYATDVAFQVAAHLLGACVYGNVCWNWYLLRHQTARGER